MAPVGHDRRLHKAEPSNPKTPFAVTDDDLSGQASIIDGYTLEIHGTRIRLRGITERLIAAVHSRMETPD
jgi:hypothetical protein